MLPGERRWLGAEGCSLTLQGARWRCKLPADAAR